MDSTLPQHSTPVRAETPKPSLGWIGQAVSGMGLILLAGLHMFAQHFMVQEGLRNFQEVADYIRQPVILTIEVLFLVFVTTHALLGVRAILFDLGFSDAAEKRLTQVLWVIGVLTVGYGLWLTWSIIR